MMQNTNAWRERKIGVIDVELIKSDIITKASRKAPCLSYGDIRLY